MKTIPYTGAERRLVPNYFKYTCYIFTAGSRIVYLLSGDAAGTEKYLPPRPPCAVTPPKIGGESNSIRPSMKVAFMSQRGLRYKR